MILPIVWWWEQLNGPQITAIMQAIWDYLFAQFDDIFEYLNNMSIDTANSEHLTIIGKLMGIPRCNIEEYNQTYFWFHYNPPRGVVHGFDHGFAAVEGENDPDTGEPYDLTKGGIFSGVADEGSVKSVTAMPDNLYRALLKGAIASNAQIGSLAMMDYIIAALQRMDALTPVCTYEFDIKKDITTTGSYLNGDVVINLGSELAWNNISTVQASIEAITDSVYAPEPRCFVEFEFANSSETEPGPEEEP